MTTPDGGGGGAAPMTNQQFGPPPGYNPGYGNQANVGYSPGQIGYIPADVAKFQFQLAQFRQSGEYDRQTQNFVKYPILWAAIWSPVTFFLAYGVLVMAWAATNEMVFEAASLSVGAKVLLLAIIWPFALTLAGTFTVGMWYRAIRMQNLLNRSQQYTP